jgi:hypothetical protein
VSAVSTSSYRGLFLATAGASVNRTNWTIKNNYFSLDPRSTYNHWVAYGIDYINGLTIVGTTSPTPSDTNYLGPNLLHWTIDDLPGGFQTTNEVWIATRTDAIPGTGTQFDPFDGSTQSKFDALMATFGVNTTIHLGPGTFQTDSVNKTWILLSGWTIVGAGISETTIQNVSTSSSNYYTVIYNNYNVASNYVTLRNLTLDANWSAIANHAPDGATVRTFTTTSATNSSSTIPSTNGAFTVLDVRRRITGTGIPANSWIGAVTDSSHIIISSSPTSNVPVNATISNGTTITISEKNAISTACTLFGSNNTYDHVRAIGAFGSGANGMECFVLNMAATYTASPSDSTNNIMTNCLVEQCFGNYGNPFCLGGNEGAPSPSFPGNLNFITNSRVEFCTAIGTNGPEGYSPTGSVTPFTSGGVNLAGVKNCRVHGNFFIDCVLIAYQDTGTFDGIEVSNNTCVRGIQGISFVVPPDGFSGFTVSGAGSAIINGYYAITGQVTNGKPFYNKSGHSTDSTRNAVTWTGTQWVIYDTRSAVFYFSNNNVTYPWQVTTWQVGSGGFSPVPTVTENLITTRGLVIQNNNVNIQRKTIGGANYAIIVRTDCFPVVDGNRITYDSSGPGTDTFWSIEIDGSGGTVTNNIIDGSLQCRIGSNGINLGAPDSRYIVFGNKTSTGTTVAGATDNYTLTSKGSVPSGGTSNQALVKNSNTDYDVSWTSINPGTIPSTSYLLKGDGVGNALSVGTPTVRGLLNEVWISNRTDSVAGVGTAEDPFDGSTQTKFDALMSSIPTNSLIHLSVGTFFTHGSAFKDGWFLHGAGKDRTVVKYPNGWADGSSNTYFGYFVFSTTSALTYAEIADLTIDLNRANQPLYTSQTTIASGSNNVDLTTFTSGSPGTINVASTTGFISSGYLSIMAGPYNYGALVSYSGKTSNSFTGCVYLSSWASPITLLTGQGVWVASSLNGTQIQTKQGKLKNIKLLGAWANPGEGFPLSIQHDGSNSESDLLEINDCEVLDAQAVAMTAISAFDQVGGVCTCVVKNCLTTATPLQDPTHGRVIAWGARAISAVNGLSYNGSSFGGALTGGIVKILNNRSIGCNLGFNHDTWDSYNIEIAGCHIESYPDNTGYGGGGITFNSTNIQKNIDIHDNYVYVSPSGGVPIGLLQPITNLQFHDNIIVTDQTLYAGAQAANGTTGSYRNNIIKEITTSTFPLSLLVYGNLDPNGNALYTNRIGQALLTAQNTSNQNQFVRINPDNTVSFRRESDFLSDLKINTIRSNHIVQLDTNEIWRVFHRMIFQPNSRIKFSPNSRLALV